MTTRGLGKIARPSIKICSTTGLLGHEASLSLERRQPDDIIERRANLREAHLKLVQEAHARGDLWLAAALDDPVTGLRWHFTRQLGDLKLSSTQPSAVQAAVARSRFRWGRATRSSQVTREGVNWFACNGARAS